MEAKYIRKQVAAQINRFEASKAESDNSDSDIPGRMPHKKKARNGVLPSRNQTSK